MKTAPHAAEIERQLIALAYRNLLPMMGVALVSAFGCAVVLAAEGYSWIWLWLAGFVALTPLRLVTWFGARKVAQNAPLSPEAAAYHRQQYALGLFASGAIWIIPEMLAMDRPSVAQYTLAIISSALACGGTGIIASLPREGRIYIVTMIGPPSIMLFLSGMPIQAALGFVFLVAMLVVHHNNHAVVRRSIELQLSNDELLHNLKSLNAGLESKVAERTEALKNVAFRDALTSLPNRRGLMEWMHSNIKADGAREAAVMFLDLDRFKQINDAMGHDVGDKILQTCAFRLSERLPPGAIIARWGGDEFVMALPPIENAREVAQRTAAELVSAINFPFEEQGQNLGLGLSVGVAYFPTDAATHKDVIQAADLAVAEVKRTGRGHALAYSDTYAETQRRRFDLGRALAEAIRTERLELHYQPIIDARTGEVAAMEALARWRHPVMGQISPDEFINLAEDTDRIVALGDWVLQRACADAARWARDNDAETAPKVAVNVSVKQLLVEDFALRVMQILTVSGLPAGRLGLEVTESLFDDEHMEATLSVVAGLRAIGVAVHIDDFGTGYSSLSRLHRFAVTTIKIDRSFVAQMGAQGGVIIESALMIARRFGMEVVAEGVETAEQAEALKRLGVDFMQGYYFGRPSPLSVASTIATAQPNRRRA